MPTSAVKMVVVVEDDDSMRESLERLLDEAGFACASFASADALLARGFDERSVCVISDLRLPGMSGLDLLSSMRASGIALPLVLITAHEAPGLREEAMRRGAAAFLPKPFRGTTLLQTVSAAIEHRPQS
jgi:two-component system response regulator FixJ